jgi:hypothetical protein
MESSRRAPVTKASVYRTILAKKCLELLRILQFHGSSESICSVVSRVDYCAFFESHDFRDRQSFLNFGALSSSMRSFSSEHCSSSVQKECPRVFHSVLVSSISFVVKRGFPDSIE